jgi:hypothetical protein
VSGELDELDELDDQADELDPAAATYGDVADHLARPMPATLEHMTPWPFGPGPYGWPLQFVGQPETETGSQPAGLHLCCGECGQSMTRLGQWGHTLETLKPQISLHVMQCHADLIGC